MLKKIIGMKLALRKSSISSQVSGLSSHPSSICASSEINKESFVDKTYVDQETISDSDHYSFSCKELSKDS